jgi:hypothetical protein
VKLMSVLPSCDVFCTIMSTLTLAAATAEQRCGMPDVGNGEDGHLRPLMSVTTPEMIGSSMLGSIGDLCPAPCEGGAERMGTLVAGELHAAQRPHLAAGSAGPSIPSKLTWASLAACGTIADLPRTHQHRCSLATVAPSARQRYRRGVAAAASERRDLPLPC